MADDKKTRMSVLFVAPCSYFDRGGVETHVREVANEFVEDGHFVTIISISPQVFSRNYYKKDSLRVICIPLGRKIINRFINANLHLLSRIKEFYRADIVHYHDYKTLCHWSVLVYPVLFLLRKKVYITFHGWEGKVPPSRVVKYQRKGAELIVRGNMCIGHFISKWYGTKPTIVSYGGVRIPPLANGELFNTVFVGRLEQDSGIMSFLQAWSDVKKQFPWMSLIVCGDGTMRTNLEEFVDNHKLRDIEFVGSVSNPQYYIMNCRLVFASGYLSILEAFSCKRPVISIYENELKKDYLVMMPNSREMMWIVRDSKGVVSSIAEALANKEKPKKAFEFAKENSWNEVKSSYYKLWGLH